MSQQSCMSYIFSSNKNYKTCNDLPVLDSSIFWNYHQSSRIVDIAFRKIKVKESSWVAWAINPTSTGMVGSQALIAFKRSDGVLVAYTSPVISYQTLLPQGNLSFPVRGVSATYNANINEMILFATIQLPNNPTLVNHVWQEGPVVDDFPRMHALSGPNLNSFGRLDFQSGKIVETASRKVNSRTKLKIAHGILNAISWGILMPIGALMARYVNLFNGADPLWFYLHVTCQSFAYFVGVVGFGTGLYLGAHSSGIQYNAHRCIGITLFSLATTQVLVGRFLRPTKDHKYRKFWNAFHYFIGYGTIALSIVNVLKGFAIMDDYKTWKSVYIGMIIGLGAIALALEVFKWCRLICLRKIEVSEENHNNQV
ncbi:Cytochrome b561 and DOMON domain-containing protein [Quillaja saponaria]|uniref:Cytochrome b561 and DOMON domain-containing protein n=1 Tax=Quillaja saponaria TaxID=32244 RepID=A0AAD7LSR0_QUISA|nr:Cytochrome b561 and DOMON domain-containing protein [Quillaja saponaria]